jgi:hypothetical protein
MSRILAVGGLLLALSLTACASQSAGERSERGGRAMLTSMEMNATGYNDLFAVIQSLRPEWLRTQGATSFRGPEGIHVYLDGNRMGGVEALQQIATRSISSAQFLSGLEATQRWGLGHGMGAIVISTR